MATYRDRLSSWIDAVYRMARPSTYRNAWHSFDRAPWRHPWLTEANLRAMREFSGSILEQVRGWRESRRGKSFRYAFIGNLGNSMYCTAQALRPYGADITILPHPADDYLMSQPEWEEFDGELPASGTSYKAAISSGAWLPQLPRIERLQAAPNGIPYTAMPSWVRRGDYLRWCAYFGYLPVLEGARKFDALFAVQAPYLAYLSRKPYIARHMGGEIWYECSRDDMLGQLQRQSFAAANLVVASNPWSYSFARRYGLRNLVHLPTLLDTVAYSPGEPDFREVWCRQSGGSFYVLTTARVDNFFKGSDSAIEGFTRFSQVFPGARLVVLSWGTDLERWERLFAGTALAGKVIALPVAGKRRLIRYLRSVDCLLDQFVLGYYGMTAIEAMSVGVPVVMHLNHKQYDAFYGAGAPPVVQAADAEQIAASLATLAENPDRTREIGRSQRRWFMEYSGNAEWAELYLDVLAATASGLRFDFGESPLGAPLSTQEIEYHRGELEQAPVFPNYC